MGALLCLARGTSVITEGIYDNRYKYINELRKMGAEIQVDGAWPLSRAAASSPGPWSRPATCGRARAMVIAGMCASGTTVVEVSTTSSWGYENFVGKLKALGADISIVNFPDEPEGLEKIVCLG